MSSNTSFWRMTIYQMNNPWDGIALPDSDVNARRIDADHPLDLFWARSHTGHYLVIFEFESSENLSNLLLPDLVGISSQFVAATDRPDQNRLILVLGEQADWEIFYSLCMDIFYSTKTVKMPSKAVRAILRRLLSWHEFLKKKRGELLPEEQIKGLIGELVFIINHLGPVSGPGQAIKFWQGPEGYPQDFNVDNSAVEVKCQSGAKAPIVKITSINQLCPQLPEMYLFVVTLGKTHPDSDDALNLPRLVSQIRETLIEAGSEQMERFNDLLHIYGYVESDRYLEFSYVLAGERMFQVSEGFPRLCPSDVHQGIVKLTYHVNLVDCEPYEGWPNWLEDRNGS